MGPKLLLCALALGTLLASSASPQVLEATILLPDSLGPLTGNVHVVFDEDSAHPRIFIGGEGGDVIVADAVTCEKLARIASGPMVALCYVPVHNKLYVSTTDGCGVAVVDCGSYQVIKRLSFPSVATGLYYNSQNDRIYCAADPLKIIDCASDSVVDSLPVNATDANCVLDSVRNKLYVSAADSLRVVDCSRDSVVASAYGLRGAQAVCFQPSAGKVYFAAGESLFALNTKSDTVVYRHGFDTLYAQLTCDPVHNRVYYSYWSHLIALDCASDSILWDYHLWGRGISLAPVPELDRLYVMLIAMGSTWKYVLDGSTGQELRQFHLTIEDSLYYSSSTGRVFVTDQDFVVTALDVRADTLAGVVPLGAPVSSPVVDSVDNKLYFICSYDNNVSRVGIVDCSTNKVKSYSRVFEKSRCLAYDAGDDKLYCSADSSIYVFDCRADTLVKEIPIDGIPCELVWYPSGNKLYAVSIFQDSALRMNVVDCSHDSITKTIGLNATSQWGTGLMMPDIDQLWVFGGSRYTVVDCLSDSVVEYATGSSFYSASYDSSNRKIYASKWTHLAVIDADSRLVIDSIPNPMRDTPNWQPGPAHCASRVRKVYWTLVHFLCADSVLVVDARSDSVVSSFSVPWLSEQACDDRTGDYVYFASDYLVVVDTRTDSIVSGIRLPLAASSLASNRKTRRFYIAGYRPDDAIQVVYDSVIFAGLQSLPGTPTQAVRVQTVLNRSAPLRCTAEAILYDATGRRATVLRPGPNDISHLAPGVYFMREGPQASSLKPQTARKIVITK